MGAVTKIQPPSKDVLAWLSKLGTKYNISDVLTTTGSPLMDNVFGWMKRLSSVVKSNIAKTKSTATKTLYQSVVTLPVTADAGVINSEMRAEEYIDYLDKGVSGTEQKYNTPYAFKNEFVGRDMIKSMQTFIAAKPIPLQGKGKSKKELNRQAAWAMAKALKKEGIKPRKIYSHLVQPDSKYITELKEIVAKDTADAVTAQLLNAFKG